ncbi:MAG: hypothetical protein HW384_1496 [Dehalococcoidia bacterium]|nr:hypothetical protein [Dehalococcoidia bacterium]
MMFIKWMLDCAEVKGMIIPAEEFNFKPPTAIVRARRVLIKPYAPFPTPYPTTVGRETLAKIVEAIRRVTDADILFLEGNPEGKPMSPIYKDLGYSFPRVMTLDVRDSLLIEIDNPLAKPYALPSVWVPNVILSCDYWISISPYIVRSQIPQFTIYNLLGLLPTKKYRRSELEILGMDRVIADIYFTLPFDLGIIDARKKLIMDEGINPKKIEDMGKVFMGDPFEIDSEAVLLSGLKPEFIELIKAGKIELES